ncbi:MAG TPA: hypothetical protein VFV31_06795 [Chitinophagaceae bacterium]|nr:hypothetical protein [Chitinophagaceae bacterium]
MKKLFLLLLFMPIVVLSQEIKKAPVSTLKKNLISVGASLPAGDFATTHTAGISLEYMRCENGIDNNNSKKERNKFRFIYGAGTAWYKGKKVTVSQYAYNYPRFLTAYSLGGVSYTATKNFHLFAAAGPGIGIYSGDASFWLTGKMEGLYFFSQKFGAATGFTLHQQLKADPLLVLSLKAVYRL